MKCRENLTVLWPGFSPLAFVVFTAPEKKIFYIARVEHCQGRALILQFLDVLSNGHVKIRTGAGQAE